MPEHLLYRHEVGTALQHVGSEIVAEKIQTLGFFPKSKLRINPNFHLGNCIPRMHFKSKVWIYFGSNSVLPSSIEGRGDSNEIRKLVYAL